MEYMTEKSAANPSIKKIYFEGKYSDSAILALQYFSYLPE